MKIDVVPDITMRGKDDPHGRAAGPRPPTVGQLAGALRDLAGRRADWWALVRFDPARPSRVRLDADSAGTAEMWLTTWPPGHRAGHTGTAGQAAEVSALIAGELAEVTIGQDGVTERPLRAGRTWVHGTGGPAGHDTRELHNVGATYAITLHARAR
ncbi:MAG TPA: cysteine dioxygenase [Streptosporangiaceae bacterium]|nr:cysteine dioxygenase [Streptosporangiaceae bacterium]